jgi:hypothetical protein
MQFSNTKPSLNEFQLTCPTILSKEFLQLISNNKRVLLHKDNLSLTFRDLNPLSMNCLNLFAEKCRHMRIESFTSSKSGEIKSNKYKTYLSFVKLNKFESLASLDLNCLFYDSKLQKYFIWDRIIDENVLFKCSYLFENLADLRIQFLNLTKNLSSFYTSIANLNNLKSLKLEHCHFYGSNLGNIEKDINAFICESKLKQLNLETLIFNSTSVFFVYLTLKYFINLNSLCTLKLFVSENKDFTSYFIKNDLMFVLNRYIKYILSTLDQKSSPNLKFLSTNLFTNFLDSANYLEFKSKIIQNESLEELTIDSEIGRCQSSTLIDYNRWILSLYDSKLIRFKFNMKDFQAIFGNSNKSNLKKLSIVLTVDCAKDQTDDVIKKTLAELSNHENLTELKLHVKCAKHGNDMRLNFGFPNTSVEENCKIRFFKFINTEDVTNDDSNCVNFNFNTLSCFFRFDNLKNIFFSK